MSWINKSDNKGTKCDECGEYSFVIYKCRDYRSICDKCKDEERDCAKIQRVCRNNLHSPDGETGKEQKDKS